MLCLAGPALADGAEPSKKECVAAYVNAQRLRKADKLSEAKLQLEICASDACPKTLTKDCVPWLAEVKANQPTLALSALGLDGRSTRTVRVSLDGQLLGSELPRDPVPVDPGSHEIRFELEGAEPIVLKIDAARGDMGKRVSADFSKQAPPPASAPPEPEAPPPAPSRPIPVPVYVLGGVGVLGLASFAFFGSKGKREENDLADTCAPNCNPDDVDASHRKLLIADISLGVGLVALGAATYFYVKRPEKGAGDTTVGVAPVRRGGTAFVRGSF
jgi:hypothetical protein